MKRNDLGATTCDRTRPTASRLRKAACLRRVCGLLSLIVLGGASLAPPAWGQERTEIAVTGRNAVTARPTVRAGMQLPPAGQPTPLVPPPFETAPQPRTRPRGPDYPGLLDPLNPARIRLPRLGIEGQRSHPCLPPVAGPQPTEKDIEEFGQFIDGVIDPKSTIDLIVGRPRLMLLKQTPTKTQIGDEAIASYELLAPREMSLLGRQVGSTVFNLWFTDPKDATKERILSYLIRVLPDPEAKTRLEQVYKALADEINDNFPDSYINLTLVGDKLVVSGQAKDIAEATQILRIVSANAPGTPAEIPLDSVQLYLTGEDLLSYRDFVLAGGPNVINLIRIPGEQQVMLRVTVAEVNRSAARSIGLNFSITNNDGITVFSQLTGNLTGSQINLPITLDNGQTTVALNALRTLNYARSLAEPVLTTMNGQTASFQAGGEFPVPVVTGATAIGLQGVQFVPFGVLLQFTPYITDKDRIRLTVSADVSTRDLSIGTNIGGAGGSNVAGLQTRNFQTTVELREGQTLAVAGLIQNNLGADSSRVPLFGDLPLFGRLASSDRISSGEQELVVLITPELVHPLEPDEQLPLPGVDIIEPGDLEFYLLGRLESRRDYDYRSAVRTDIHKMLRYRHCEDIYIYGPKGHSAGPIVSGIEKNNAPRPAPGPLTELKPGK